MPMLDPTTQATEDAAMRAVLVNRLPELAEQTQFRHSLAVVVGIDAYGPGIPRLRTAVNDATRLAELLAALHGYEAILLTGQETGEPVSGERLRSLFSAELPARLDQDDRLLFYFAGHGVALDGDDGPAGYLVPQDARADQPASLLPMTDLHDWLAALPCRHMLAILDCCFAGAFRWASTRHIGALPEVIHQERFERYLRSPAWQVLTSAAYDQKALDVLGGNVLGRREAHGCHSPFAQALIAALEKGEADLVPRGQGDGVITATELYLYLREQVEVQAEAQVGHQQTPGMWPLKKHRKGEFVFLVPGHLLNLPPAPELTGEANPYRGLKSYDQRHTQLFFGREDEISELAALVDRQPFVAVLGASGTGKSSLVKAGLLPRLQGRSGTLQVAGGEGAAPYHVLAPMRPTDQPLQALAALLRAECDAAPSGFGNPKGLAQDDHALAQIVARWTEDHPGQRLVLTIDQFEELATLCRDDGERERFLRLLAAAVQQQPDAFRLILTLRTDFEPQFTQEGAPLAGLWPASRYVVPPMDIEDLRQVIEGPASVRVLYFDPPELVDDLIKEVIQTPGALPLLSFTLSELYVKYVQSDRDDRALSRADYRALGGVVGSLRNRASEEYDRLADDDHRATMQRVMLRMVAVEGGGELARRRVALSELVYLTEQDNLRVQAVLDRLVDARLLVRGTSESPDGTKGETYVEPAHDALVLAWDKLLRWKKEAEEYLPLQRRLAQAATEWNKAEPETRSGLLWDDDPRLPQLEEMVRPAAGRFGWARRVLAPERGVPPDTKWLNDAELAFVQKSIEARARFWRRVVGATTLLALVLVTATVVSLLLRDRAVKAEATAVAESTRALNAEGTAIAEATRALNAEGTAVAEATRALNAESTAVAEATRALNAESTAVAEATRALNAEATAVANEQIAREKQAEAEREARRAWAGVLAGRGQADIRENKNANDTGILLTRAALLTTLYGDGYYTRNAVETLDLARVNVHWQRTFLPKGVRHRGPVKAVVYSPDGTRLLSAGRDATLIVWDAATMEPAHTLQGHADSVLAVAWNPDGTRIVSGGADNALIVWDVETLSPMRILRGHSGPVNSVAWSPNGEKIASGSADGTLVIWDATEMTPTTTLSDHTEAVTSVAWSPDGARIVSGSHDDTLILWNTETLAQVHRLEGHSGDVKSAAWSPDGSRIVSGSDDGTLIVWDASGLKLGQSMPVDPIASVAWAPVGIHIVSGSPNGTLIQWDARMLWPEQIVDGHGDWVDSVAWSPDGTHIALSSLTGMPTVRAATTLTAVHTWQGHRLFVKSVAWSPDGRKIASGSRDGTVMMWDAATLEPGPLMSGHRDAVNSIAWSPDGTRLASGSTDKMIVIWDVTTLEIVVTLSGHSDGVNSVAWSPDGARIVSGDEDGMLIVWDAISLVRAQTVRSENAIRAVAWSPDGTRIVSGSFDRTVKVWDAATLTPLRPPMTGHTQVVTSVAWSPDGTRIVSGSADNKLIIWDATNLTQARTLVGHRDWVSSVVWSSDSSRIVSGSVDRTLIIWDAVAGDRLQTLQGHSGYVTMVAVSPDGRRIVSGSADYSLIVWDDTTLPATENLLWHRDEVTCVAWSPNGDRIVSGSVDTKLIVWDVKTLSWIRILNGHDGAVTTLAWSPDGSDIISGSWDGTLIVWDARSWTRGRPLSGHKGVITTVAWSPDGMRFVSGGQDNTLIVWDAVTQNPIQILHEHSDEVTAVAWSPDGRRIVSASKDGILIVWDASTLVPVRSLQDRNGSVLSLAWSPDGALFVSGTTGGILTVWDAMTLVPTQTLRGHKGRIYAVAWSPDGTRIVSGSGQHNVWQTPDNALIVWDVATWMPLGTLEGHREPVSSVTWSPDGRQIASGSADQTLKVWPVTDGVLAMIETQILRPSWVFTVQERVEYGIPNALADWLASIPPLPMYTPTAMTEPVVGPAPAATLTPQVMGLAITEIMYDPPPDPEFIEVTNLGAVSVDLSGATFTGITFTFPDGATLHPGESLVVVRDLAAFVAGHPEVTPTGVFTGKLANEGERITLRRANGEILASVHYGVSGDWPVPGDQRGSLVLVDPNGDPDDPINWRLSTHATGSPGRYPD